MTVKTLISLMVFALILGGSIGGAFIGGIALGKGQESGGPEISLPSQSLPTIERAQEGQITGPTQEQIEDIRERFQSGELTREEVAQLRQQFLNRQGMGGGDGEQGARARGGIGGGRILGTIESIDGNTVTINTPQGPLEATIGSDSVIQRFSEGSMSDLEEGLRITITGQRTENGVLEVTSILIAPEGAGGFLNREELGQRNQR